VTGQWDARLLAQVFANLLGNAAVHGGGTPVTVTARRCGHEAVIEVHNGGRPIPESLLPDLFDPYRKGHVEIGSKNLGLGLFIAHEIVRAHGGTITVRSTAAKGTCFTVRLPLERAPSGS
jgi:sigma-B regulation protein RsbU (phosphoserine phosphatase)